MSTALCDNLNYVYYNCNLNSFFPVQSLTLAFTLMWIITPTIHSIIHG